MNAKILPLALVLVAPGLVAQNATPAKPLSHEELVRRATNQTTAPTETTAATVPDWSATNTTLTEGKTASATPQQPDAAATKAAAERLAQARAAALTNRAAGRPPRATLPAFPTPNAPAATAAPAPTAVPTAVPSVNVPPAATPAPAAVTPAPAATAAPAGQMTLRPAANPSNIPEPDKIFPAGSIDWPAATLEQVLQIYSELVGRNLLRPTSLNMKTDIVLKQTTPLTKLEVVQMIEAAMYLNQVSVIDVGEKFVTVMPTAEAFKIPGMINTNDVTALPLLGSMMTHVVQLKYSKPSEMVNVLTPFASGTAPNPILPVDSSGILVLRDNVANVKRMLEMIEKVDVVAQSEIISEVIPIKYAKAEEIASALSSVGGGTAGSIGTRSSTSSRTSGAGRVGTTQPGAYNQPGTTPGLPGATPTPSSSATFGDRVRNLISRAASSGEFSILGETKIIADIRSNSLLVFATKQDMEMIKDIIGKLDVVLAQVLIETIIMDVSLGNKWEFGVSAAQNQMDRSSGKVSTVGGYNNSNPFFNFGGTTATNLFPGNLTSTLPDSSFSYFSRLGSDPSFEMALKAAASDNRVNVIQKPRILTSHATPASIFVGSTVPYVTGTYYGYGAGTGGSSSYQQLKVGIGLDVTPFINQDGLVVMQIQETIDEVSGFTTIENVGEVPTTTSRTLSAEVAVRDGESIVLGGFIRNSDSKNKSGVPLLKDIPLLGALFSSRSADKNRTELMVLMRPTVLRTPELAAMHVDVEKQRLPGVRAAERELDKVELKRVEAEEQRHPKATPPPAAQPDFDRVTPFSPQDERILYSPTP